MSQTHFKVRMEIMDDQLFLHAEVNGTNNTYQTTLEDSTVLLLTLWMINSCRNHFCEMPFDIVETGTDQELEPKANKAFHVFASAAKVTNNVIRECKGLKDFAREHTNVLYFNLDNNSSYQKFFTLLQELDASKLLYQNMASGFDSATRTWREAGPPLSLDDLIRVVAKYKIKKIISVSTFVSEKYLAQGLFFPAFVEYLGLEHICLDNDPFDDVPGGYLRKAVTFCPSSPRYSLASILQKEWDDQYSIPNVNYIPMPQRYEYVKQQTLNPDYSLLVLSNSRIGNVINVLPTILYILDNLDEKLFFSELHTWYYAMRRLLLADKSINDFHRINIAQSIWSIFYAVAQFVKYEVIDSIDSNHPIKIYGDHGWSVVFPEYYQNKYLDPPQKEHLLKSGNYLYLLLNHSFNYLDTSAAIYEAICVGVPFVSHRSLVKSDSFQGFESIEYHNADRLNHLINNAAILTNTSEFETAKTKYLEVLNSSITDMAEQIVFNKHSRNNLFTASLEEHQALLDTITDDFILSHNNFLEECRQYFWQLQSIPYDITTSRFYNRTYYQRLTEYKKKLPI
ncbi:MAG: hypothetical protein ACM3UZ_14645 [Acidobacteriota bacterium]